MTKPTIPATDEHTFLRRRAMALLDEGMLRSARRLISVIDREQAGRIAAELKESWEAMARKKV